ncbi:hypothetical protein CGC57_05895 [Capnocytophaga sputigena]|nr:hypothetical protein CGC57_05895 [Capnocytophaga sputigena]
MPLADGSHSTARLLKNSSHRLIPRRDERKGIVVINHKTTKFESNSQYNVMIFICFLNNNSYLCTLI